MGKHSAEVQPKIVRISCPFANYIDDFLASHFAIFGARSGAMQCVGMAKSAV